MNPKAEMPLESRHMYLRRGLHLILILLAGLLVYSNTFDVPLQFDDSLYLSDSPANPEIATSKQTHYLYPNITDFGNFITPDNTKSINPAIRGHRYFITRFMGYLSLWLNYRLSGMNIFWLHFVNLCIHLLNGVLIYLIVQTAFKTPNMKTARLSYAGDMLPLLSALLFVSHPIATEAVTYISQRFVELTTAFCLLSLTFYTMFVASNKSAARKMFYTMALLASLLSMITKENAFTFPLVIILFDMLFVPSDAMGRIKRLLPFAMTMAIIPSAYLASAPLAETTRLQSDIDRWHYLITQFSVIVSYLGLLFFPSGQNVDRRYHELSSILEPEAAMSLIIIMAIAIGTSVFFLINRKRSGDSRLVFLGVAWFFISLSVESTFIPISQLYVEYRVYLPSAGFFIALTTVLFLVIDKIIGDKRKARYISAALIVCLVVSYGSAAYIRNEIWRDPVTLWRDSVSKSANNPRSHYNLALAYLEEGYPPEAYLPEFKATVELDPNNYEAYINLGNTYFTMGLTDKALRTYEKAIEINPANAQAYHNLALLYESMGKTDKANALNLKARSLEAEGAP